MLEYTVLKHICSLFSFFSNKQNVVYDIIVHVHRKRFYLCLGGNHFKCKDQI